MPPEHANYGFRVISAPLSAQDTNTGDGNELSTLAWAESQMKDVTLQN